MASSGRGAEAAFASRRHVRKSATRRCADLKSQARRTLFAVGGTDGSTGCLPCTLPYGGGGGTIMSGIATSPPSLSMTGC